MLLLFHLPHTHTDMHPYHFNKKAFFANAFVQHLSTQRLLALHETLQRDVARKKNMRIKWLQK